MSKYPTKTKPRNAQFLLMIISLLIISFACNLPRSIVDRDYLACEESGGEWIIDDKGARCEYPSTSEIEASPNQDSKEIIPAGTFRGEFTETEMATRGLVEWEVQGTVDKNEITIVVANDGTVTGQFFYVKTGNILFSDDSHGTTCTDSNDQSFFGEAAGQLIDSTGKIVFEIQIHVFIEFIFTINFFHHISEEIFNSDYIFKM